MSLDEDPLDVLLIDDSAVVREVMQKLLSRVPGIRLTIAADAILGLEKMRRRRPNVILLDLTLPRMDGFAFLEHMMATDPIPVVVLSGTAPAGSDRALRALDLGAVDLIAKPAADLAGFLQDSVESLIDTIRSASMVRLRKRGLPSASPLRSRGERPAVSGPPSRRPDLGAGIVAIGASTGGPDALRAILERIEGGPGIVIAQHMPVGFTGALARSLNATSPLAVSEARDGDPIRPGTVLVSPGDHHIRVAGRPGAYRVSLDPGPRVNRHRPSIDLLFHSLARVAGRDGIGVLLTGMGSDGSDGLAALKRAGGYAIAESEDSAAVYGMPRHAIERGLVDRVLAKERIAAAILAEAEGRLGYAS